MYSCNIIHPLLNFKGVNQKDRINKNLDPDQLKIDDQEIYELVHFVYQFSRQINYYDNQLNVYDWRPFFADNPVVAVAELAHVSVDKIRKEYEDILHVLAAQPEPHHLQLLFDFIHQQLVNPLTEWHRKLGHLDIMPVRSLSGLIQTDLQDFLIRFLGLWAGAKKWFGLNRPNSQQFTDSPWQLNVADLYSINESFMHVPGGQDEQIKNCSELADPVFARFAAALQQVTSQATVPAVYRQILLPEDEELKQKHPPHFALMYAFFKLYQVVQNSLNQLSSKHLDFFYQQVLKLKTLPAIPDQLHLVFEIQKQLENYLLKEGDLFKDGKDENKVDILFRLNKNILIDKSQISSLKTLFLNHSAYSPNVTTKYNAIVEGLYIAPDARMANGIDQPFASKDMAWPTLGAKNSGVILQENKKHPDYPYGRIGFVLASPILYLAEGRREIKLTLNLAIDQQEELNKANCADVGDALLQNYYLITEHTLEEALKNQYSDCAIYFLKEKLAIASPFNLGKTTKEAEKLHEVENLHTDGSIPENEKDGIINSLEIKAPLKIQLSGAEDWVIPRIDFSKSAFNQIAGGNYQLYLVMELMADQPAVTFFNEEILEEKLGTSAPVMKIEIEPEIRLRCNSGTYHPECCLEPCEPASMTEISFYHFFREMQVSDATFEVNVCGLKNIIVQNDENIQDVNSQVYPFGVRPDVKDFSVVNPPYDYCITHQLVNEISDSSLPPNKKISNATKNYLIGKIGNANKFGIYQDQLSQFLDDLKDAVNQTEREKVEDHLNEAKSSYCNYNLEGPNFYIGSKEIFYKKWEKVNINLNWKEKPSDFKEYYKAYTAKEISPGNYDYGIKEEGFQINLAMLEDGHWKRDTTGTLNPISNHLNRKLFEQPWSKNLSDCEDHYMQDPTDSNEENPFDQSIIINASDFNTASVYKDLSQSLEKYDVNTSNGFLRFTLENQDFLHADYPFVLARQMMALGRLPDVALEGAVYIDHATNNVITFKDSVLKIQQLLALIEANSDEADVIEGKYSDEIYEHILDLNNEINRMTKKITDSGITSLKGLMDTAGNWLIDQLKTLVTEHKSNSQNLEDTYKILQQLFSFFDIDGKVLKPLEVPIPNEPWTPIIKDIALDYTATAEMEDISLIHLHPFTDTYEAKAIDQQVSLLPTFRDEGTLFIGLQELKKGNNLNLFFQVAEITADSELEKADIKWFYLSNNRWLPLREGFEIIEDDTNGLAQSGIVEITIPENITIGSHTILPADNYWIKAVAPANSKAVSKTISVHTRAAKATYAPLPDSDPDRLSQPLEAKKISKLLSADANVKKIEQPFASFNGKRAEKPANFRQRVSEHLRHKGRAITAFDYERLVLQRFNEIYLAKCINHTFGLPGQNYQQDLELAPGFLVIAVFPDTGNIAAENLLHPKVPVSTLDTIHEYLRSRTSPFVRLKILNPRYEKVHLEVKFNLKKRGNASYFEELLRQDLKDFFAPWKTGQLHKIGFGLGLSRSSLVAYLENLDYVDFICCLGMIHEAQVDKDCQTLPADQQTKEIRPLTARSILTAGKIKVEAVDNPCEGYDRTDNFRCEQQYKAIPERSRAEKEC